MASPFGDVLTAMVTPFTPNGDVDYGQAWALARYLTSHGSDGIVVAGTTGESPTLTDVEKVALFRTVVEAVGDRATVVAGSGTYDTKHSVEMSRRAADVGCRGLMAVTPYYSKPPQEGLYRHFVAIAEATELSVLLYNIPGRTARLIEVETLAKLAEHPQIVAVKDAVDDMDYTTRAMSAVPEGFAVYSGSDSHTLRIVSNGGAGVVSVVSHLAGPEVKRLVEAAKSGDMAEAERLDEPLQRLTAALFAEPNPMPVKAALNEAWGPVGEPRLPLVAAKPETTKLALEALGEVQRA